MPLHHKILSVGVVVLILLALVVPWQRGSSPAGYRFIFAPPEGAVHVDATRLLVPMFVVVVATGAAVYLTHHLPPRVRKPEPLPEPAPTPPIPKSAASKSGVEFAFTEARVSLFLLAVLLTVVAGLIFTAGLSTPTTPSTRSLGTSK